MEIAADDIRAGLRHGAEPPAGLDALEAAANARDALAMRAAIADMMQANGVEAVGAVGDTAEYDRALHQLLPGTSTTPGELVDILRPGARMTYEGEDIVLSRAVVAPSEGAERQVAGYQGRRGAAERGEGPGAEPGEVPEAARPYHTDLDGIEDLAQGVEEGAAGRPVTLSGGGLGDTYQVNLRNGERAVRKVPRTLNPTRAQAMNDAEQAVSMLGRSLGLDVPAVYRNDATGVWMEFIDHPTVDRELAATAGDRAAVEDLQDRLALAIDSDQGVVAGLLDMMIGNVDRHIGNWMLTGDEGFALIDHGSAFGPYLPGDIMPPRLVMPSERLFESTLDGPFARNFVGRNDLSDTVWAENALTPADIEEIRARLDALEPAFDHIGRSEWLERARHVLDTIEPYATGSRNLIAEG
jgi:hypothetical protein